MTSQVTVADLRIQIGDLFPTGDSFLTLLNQATQRLVQSGRWAGSQVYCSWASVPLGYVTLPYELLSIMGVNIGGFVAPQFGNMHEFIVSGPGHIDETQPATGIFDFLNDGYPTRIDIPTPGSTLRITLTNAADFPKTWRLYGTDENDKVIFSSSGEGIPLATTALSTDTTQKFNSITGIQCPVSANGYSNVAFPWRLYAVSPLAVATELSYYYPNESRPSYARYKTGVWNTDGVAQLAVRALCQRRYIPVYKETDWVIPGSTGALKAALQAVQNEDATNYAEADPLWERAISILNNEVHSARGGNKPELSIPQSQFGGWYGEGGLSGWGFGGCS